MVVIDGVPHTGKSLTLQRGLLARSICCFLGLQLMEVGKPWTLRDPKLKPKSPLRAKWNTAFSFSNSVFNSFRSSKSTSCSSTRVRRLNVVLLFLSCVNAAISVLPNFISCQETLTENEPYLSFEIPFLFLNTISMSVSAVRWTFPEVLVLLLVLLIFSEMLSFENSKRRI